MKLLYIHGYNGSPNGGSYNLLKKYLPAGWEIIGMDYCQDDCAVALEQIHDTVRKEKIDVVAGSSLGGFLTLLVSGIRRFVINPCYRPSVELPKLGPHNGLPAPSVKMIATYAAFEDRLKQIPEADRKNIHCLMADHDELLGFRFYDEIARDLGKAPRIVFSSHHLSESAARTVCCLLGNTAGILQDAHRYSSGNKEMIRHSNNCGCFSCESIFPAAKLEDWIEDDGGETPVCPYCHIDAVLPDACPYDISVPFLKKMHEKWF